MFILQALFCGVHGGFRSSDRLDFSQTKLPVAESRDGGFEHQPFPAIRHRLARGPLMQNGVALLIFQARSVGRPGLLVKFKAEIILNVQLRRPGVRIENHQVFRAGIGGGNLPRDLFRRPINGLIGHFFGESVGIMRNDVLLREAPSPPCCRETASGELSSRKR